MRDLYRDKRDKGNGNAMTSPTTPAERIIGRFGVENLSRWTGRHRSRVHAWTWHVARGGTGGSIPPRVRQKIIDGARAELGEQIAFSDFEAQGDERYLMNGLPPAPAADRVPEDVQ